MRLNRFMGEYWVPLVMLMLAVPALTLSSLSPSYVAQELILRVCRHAILVLALLPPISAWMGLNLALGVGALAGQIGLIIALDLNVGRWPGLLLAMAIGLLLASLIGLLAGWLAVLSRWLRLRGIEMLVTFLLAFVSDGIYQAVLLYGPGKFFPIHNAQLLLQRGFGIRSTLSLEAFHGLLSGNLRMGFITLPAGLCILVATLCIGYWGFLKSRMSMDVQGSHPKKRNLVLVMMFSMGLAAIGQIVALQDLGVMATYAAPGQSTTYTIAALIAGGATFSKSRIRHLFLGVLLLHSLFITLPSAAQRLTGHAMLGEYYRQILILVLVLVAIIRFIWGMFRKNRDKEPAIG